MLLEYQSTSQKTYMCGDYNIDLLKVNNLKFNEEYFHDILSAGYIPTITLPTILSVSSSLIDNIFTTNLSNDISACILNVHISDHQPVIIFCNDEVLLSRTKYITNSQHSVDVPPGFTKTHATKNRDRYNEKKRQKVVHGTADSLNCFFHGGKSRTDNLQKFSKCDLFLQHCDHSTTVELVKHHLRMNSIDTTGIRVDVASKEIAEFRSFRMLAPNDLRLTLLQPDLWPEGVRVKDYVICTKPYKTVSKSKYRGRQY